MPGAGEFKIGSSAPMVERTGVKPNTFHADKTISGGSDALAAETASQPVVDQFFASKLGLMQKCIGVQWDDIGAVHFFDGAS